MAQHTQNYNLTKPELTDRAVITDFNTNWDIIDLRMWSNLQKINNLSDNYGMWKKTIEGLAKDMDNAKQTLTTHENDISDILEKGLFVETGTYIGAGASFETSGALLPNYYYCEIQSNLEPYEIYIESELYDHSFRITKSGYETEKPVNISKKLSDFMHLRRTAIGKVSGRYDFSPNITRSLYVVDENLSRFETDSGNFAFLDYNVWKKPHGINISSDGKIKIYYAREIPDVEFVNFPNNVDDLDEYQRRTVFYQLGAMCYPGMKYNYTIVGTHKTLEG